jgi:hypothetical protein
MPASIRMIWAGGVAISLVALVGCSKQSSALTEVSGTVTLDGKPLSGVLVTFYPVSAVSTDARRAYSKGTTDESGKFTLTCEDGRPGAVTGKHKVTVDWPRNYDRSVPAKPTAPPIPTPYTLVSTTPMEKEVAAGPNTIAVELTRQ